MTKFILLIAFTITTCATSAQDNSKTEAEIRRLEQIVVTAILNADTNRLKQVWAPEFLVNNPRNDISGNRNSVLLTQKAGMINYSSFERVIERMQFQKSFIITMGHETFITRNDIPGARAGQTYKRRFTNIWMKKKWEVATNSKTCFNNLSINNNYFSLYQRRSTAHYLGSLLHNNL